MARHETDFIADSHWRQYLRNTIFQKAPGSFGGLHPMLLGTYPGKADKKELAVAVGDAARRATYFGETTSSPLTLHRISATLYA
ncbi:MAG TPA: hypothetical protein VFV92_00530 [Candidatus Bathyarchaeia archaeon]|nr:hypothetical protein [Candidatus Bathyarchaeia archaeon]